MTDIPVHNSGAGHPNFPPPYVSPIAKMRMADIAASNKRLAGGAHYVSPIVKEILSQQKGS